MGYTRDGSGALWTGLFFPLGFDEVAHGFGSSPPLPHQTHIDKLKSWTHVCYIVAKLATWWLKSRRQWMEYCGGVDVTTSRSRSWPS